MKRFACNAAVCLVVTIGFGASTAQAQVLPADDSKLNVEFNFGVNQLGYFRALLNIEALTVIP